MPKKKKEHSGKKLAHAPLGAVTKHAELSRKIDQKGVERHARNAKGRGDDSDDDGDEEGNYVPVSLSRKVMQLAREQQEEVESELREKKRKEEDDMVDDDDTNAAGCHTCTYRPYNYH